MGPGNVSHCILLLFSHLFLYTLALDCEVIPGTLTQIDAGVGLVGGVNNKNEAVLLIGNRFEKIGSSTKHFTIGPAGELVANLSNHVFKFWDGGFRLIEGIQFKQVDAGGDQIIVGVSQTDDVFCLNKDSNNVGPSSDAPWTQLTGKLSYYSCGPYSCWGVNSAGNIFLRRSVTGASCGGSGAFESITGSLAMIEVATDGNIFGVTAQGNLVQRTNPTPSNPPGSSWSNVVVCPSSTSHKFVTSDLGRLYVICSDGSVRRCI
ncbi:fish-egg lectin-like [Danio aesculapii]|uniref:fish-egg lectin-like n=1 Tax=Danio aesculapii TaxID=1142201 RepID=UPI0024BFD445|nr:fish-egg lectin-like [Danio aesculapii]